MRPEKYVGLGYPFVFDADDRVINRLKGLFNQRLTWSSAELNREVGWQFSQGIFHLRRQFTKAAMRVPPTIITERTGPREFQYRLVPGVD